MIDTTSEPMKAAYKVDTLNPVIKIPKYQNSIVFTIKGNKPRVRIFNGKVRRLIIGFKNMLNTVKHAPTMNATFKGLTATPGTKFAVRITAAVRISQCKIIFIMKCIRF